MRTQRIFFRTKETDGTLEAILFIKKTFVLFDFRMSLTEYTMGSNAAPRSEAEFQKLSQTIATSIQKMLQNGIEFA